MPIDVVMPQMGESIAEGTIVKWLKKVGEKVERDEPLLEISTDKVDAEIPSPSSGTLTAAGRRGRDAGAVTRAHRHTASRDARRCSAGADRCGDRAERRRKHRLAR
jgi:hypothetical protein